VLKTMPNTGSPPNRIAPWMGGAITASAIAALAVLAVGCGGSSSAPKAHSTARPTPSTSHAQLVKFAQCMTSHGVPAKQVLNALTSPNEFPGAQKACRSLLPRSITEGQQSGS
jgi:hypothetical protein